jgi:hypothetical protein
VGEREGDVWEAAGGEEKRERGEDDEWVRVWVVGMKERYEG